MTEAPGPLPSVGVVVLTRGDRPAELRRALDSALRQTGVAVTVVCVGNGWLPVDLPEAVRTVALPENLGVGARNLGGPLADGELRLRIERFALTANNITYAAFGEAMRYWDFFPTGDAA